MTTTTTTTTANSQTDSNTMTTTTTSSGNNSFKKTESQTSNNRMKKDYEDDKQSIKGFFRRAVPTMPRPLAVICLILNIFIPGSGTLVSGFSIFFCATHNYNTNIKSFFINMLAGLMQLGSAIIIFGWIWSIKYGLLFIRLSDKSDEVVMEPNLPLFVRRHSSMETNNIYQNIHMKPRLNSLVLTKVKEEDS